MPTKSECPTAREQIKATVKETREANAQAHAERLENCTAAVEAASGRHPPQEEETMMMKLIELGFWMGAMVMLMATLPAHADTEWHYRGPGVTSAGLANLDAKFLGVAGLSWPDGRQGIITMWRREGNAYDTGEPFRVTYRCVDFFEQRCNQQAASASWRNGRAVKSPPAPGRWLRGRLPNTPAPARCYGRTAPAGQPTAAGNPRKS